MVTAKWISSFTLGLALACQGSPLQAQAAPTDAKPAPADAAACEDADETAEACDDADAASDEACDNETGDNQAAETDQPERVDHTVVPASSIGTNADDETSPETFGIGRGRIPAGGNGMVPDSPVSELIKERFPNGSVNVERRVTQDAQGNYVNHGSWKMWDQRGNPVAQGAYDFGTRTGVWTRWYRTTAEIDLFTKAPYAQFTGPFISQASFKHDQLDGVWTIYDNKTRKISQIRFADGKRHGSAAWWYASGRKMREAEYRDGALDGQFNEWSPEGKLTIKETFQAGRKMAVKTSTHPSGRKKSEGTYLFAKETVQSPDDWWNCRLLVTSKSGPEEKNGTSKSWFDNAQLQMEGSYERDVQVGTFSWWHANGQRAQEGRFDSGKQDGSWTWWYPTGQKSIAGEYTHGTPTGRWTWWKEDGRVVQSADLSHSDGIAVDLPTTPGGVPMPRNTNNTPALGKPIIKR
jgi:antitoxin component YwqK of YwqJK toxin-antitoxin module